MIKNHTYYIKVASRYYQRFGVNATLKTILYKIWLLSPNTRVADLAYNLSIFNQDHQFMFKTAFQILSKEAVK